MAYYAGKFFAVAAKTALTLEASFASAIFLRAPARTYALSAAFASMTAFVMVSGIFTGKGYQSVYGGSCASALFLVFSAGFAALALPEGFLKKAIAAPLKMIKRRRYEHMDLWLETTEKISSRLDTAEIKNLFAEICGRAIGAFPVHIWLFEAASRSFIANSLNIEPALRRIRAQHHLIERIKAASGQPFILKEALTPEELASFAAPVNAEVCVPLIAHREIIGFMLAGRRGRPAYSEDDLRVLGAIAAQAAIQLKNVRLSCEVLDMKESDNFNRMSSFVAHDLKNLTNSMALLGHNARTNMADPAFQLEALRAIDATVVKMRSLVDKMSGGLSQLEISPIWCDIREVFARAASRLSPVAFARLRVANGLPLPCMVDEELVETVFLNILTNASEATANNELICVSFHQERASLAVVISDNGSGIPMPFLENGLFRPFRTTKKDGFGIGLYQCKTVMEAHGGTIEVESEEGRGASFTLKFPAPVEHASGKAC